MGTLILRQSTAATVAAGPFVDVADGFTGLTGLSSQTGRYILGGSGAALTPSSWAHDGGGVYLVGLSTTHTAIVGMLRLTWYDAASYLPVWVDAMIVEEAVYDALFAASAAGYSTYAGADTSGTTTLLSRLTATRAGYLDGLSAGVPTAAAIATAVWAALTSALTTAGSIGAYLVARLATAGIAITNRGLASGGLRLVQGDAYLVADSSNIEFTFTNSESYSLSGKTGRLTATNHAGDGITITASFAQSGTTVTVTLGDVTAATSAAWVPGRDYHGQLEADVSVSGPVTVLEMTVEIVADIA